MLLDLVQLRTFVVVAEEQHMTRAADRLYISQSAASNHVRAVEEALGTKLFLRTNRKLELTQAGHLVLHKAKDLLTEHALLISFARNLNGKIEGRLVVGASNESGSRVGDILTTMRNQHPLVRITVISRSSGSAQQGLQNGELDVALVLGSLNDPAFTYYRLTTVRYRVAGPIAWKEAIHAADWTDLVRMPWLTPLSSSAYSALLGQLFGERGLALNSVIEFDSSITGLAALKAGAGMMLLREEHALQGESAGELALSPIAHAETSLCMAHQSGRQHDPLIQAFVEATRVAWPDMHPVETNGG